MPNETGEILAVLRDAGIPYVIDETGKMLDVMAVDSSGRELARERFRPPSKDDVLYWLNYIGLNLENRGWELDELAERFFEAHKALEGDSTMTTDTEQVLTALQDAGIPHGIDRTDGSLEIVIRDGIGNLLMRGDFAPPYRDDVLEWMQIQYEDFDLLADEYRMLADMCAEAVKGLTEGEQEK